MTSFLVGHETCEKGGSSSQLPSRGHTAALRRRGYFGQDDVKRRLEHLWDVRVIFAHVIKALVFIGQTTYPIPLNPTH